MSEKDWRPEIDAEIYFGGQKKTLAVADRRPVIRKAADLVGPGINAQATPITDFNNLLATYNGYYSAVTGSFAAPNDDEAFVGVTVMDATMGGFQLFTGLGTGTGLGATWRRRFIRNPSDPDSISWGAWDNESEVAGEPVGMIGAWMKSTPPAKHLILDGSSFSAVTYPELSAFLGGTTLPDLRDRTIYGVGAEWSLLSTDGLAYGSRDRNLYHTHNVAVGNAGEHAHFGGTQIASLETNLTTGGGGVQRAGPETAHYHWIQDDGDHTHGAFTWDDLSSGPVLRGIGMNWIIRAAS